MAKVVGNRTFNRAVNTNLDTNQNNMYDMAQNSDRNYGYNYTDTQAWPEYNPNMFKGMGHGRFDMQNMRLPSNLSRDMGASNYQAPAVSSVLPTPVHPSDNDLDANWANKSTIQSPEKTGILQNIKNWGQSIMDKTMMGQILGNFKDSPQEKFNRQYFAGKDQPGVYDGRIGDAAGNVFGNKNVSYAFGPGLEVGAQKRIDTINKTLSKWESDEEKYAKQLANTSLYRRRDAFKKQLAQYNAGLAADKKARIDAERQGTRAADTSAGAFRDTVQLDPGGGGGGGSWHGQTAAKERQGVQVHGPGFGKGAYFNQGGRAGYNRGRVVNPGGYAGEDEFEDENTLEFMQDQGIPYSEMAETSPFEMRIEELMDEGMSWQEAYEIASKEFGQIAEGPQESFSEEGIASLV